MTKTDLIKLIMLKSIRLPRSVTISTPPFLCQEEERGLSAWFSTVNAENRCAMVSCLQNRHDVRVEAKSCGNFFP